MNTASAVRADSPAANILEARFGLRIAARLSEANRELPHDISERLRIARQQALSQVPAKVALRQANTAAATSVAGGGRGGAVLGGGSPSWWARLGGLVPLLALLAGFWAIHEWTYHEQITAAATIDTALLSDTLPPAAYTDPGFDEFLRTPETVADTPAAP